MHLRKKSVQQEHMRPPRLRDFHRLESSFRHDGLASDLAENGDQELARLPLIFRNEDAQPLELRWRAMRPDIAQPVGICIPIDVVLGHRVQESSATFEMA